jgi:hypothetical protein
MVPHRVPIYSPDNPNGRRGHGLCTVTTPSAIGGTGLRLPHSNAIVGR